MKFTQFLNRLLVIVAILGFVTFGNVVPAIAAQDSPNQITDNLTMPNIQKKAEESLNTTAYDTNPEYTSEDNSNQGLNEIQGTADFDKMKRSSNEDTPPIVKQVEKSLSNVGDKVSLAKEDTKKGVDSALDKAGDAASYIKDKTGDAINSLTEKASDTAKSIKNKIKS
ncbi:MAG: hypothetical protein DCF19_16115 [Pseudanabaena frigida]|uniref:Uncharacterized protein n=1 Tax=Pseudanabaena frigida TaxID=945775 RepID=A0A2W4W912_9CYAN|nr:MAG: hypothetical protein DCF19_16115 [Pseudanabaena frigida]